MEYAVSPITDLKSTDETMSFSGYGAVFGNIDSYGDVIAPGAFAEALSQFKAGSVQPAMLWQHNPDWPIGVWSAMSEDGHGLQVEGKLASTTLGKDAYSLLKMNAVTGMSIGYVAKEWTPRTKPDEPRRVLKKIELYEVSLVTFPANDKARVSSVKTRMTERNVEEALRALGFSRKEAKILVAEGYKALPDRDGQDDNGKLLRDAGEDDRLAEKLGNLLKSMRTHGG